MTKIISLNQEQIISKIESLLTTQAQKSKLEEEIQKKINELKSQIAESYRDSPEIVAYLNQRSIERGNQDEFTINFEEFKTVSKLTHHFVDAFAGLYCLSKLDWNFKLSVDTFPTIKNLDNDSIVKLHIEYLFNVMDRLLAKKGKLELENRFKLEGFSFYIIPDIFCSLNNCLYRLTNKDQFDVVQKNFNTAESEFLTIKGEDKGGDDFEDEICYIDLIFKDQKIVDLLNEHIEQFKSMKPTNQHEEDYS